LVKDLHLDELGTRQDREAGIELVLLHITDRCPQLVKQLLDSELRDLMHHDEQHFIMVRWLGERPLLRE
jgi:hypothetical protein